METEEAEVRTLGGQTKRVRRVVGDSPQHGKHLLWDSLNNTIAELDGGLAFAIGVACIEAELANSGTRFWEVRHPNNVAIYHVACTAHGQATVTHIGA